MNIFILAVSIIFSVYLVLSSEDTTYKENYVIEQQEGELVSLIENIKLEEGFSGVVYQDHLGFDTIGYGCKLPLTQDEAELILNYRLSRTINGINSSLYFLEIPNEAWHILYEMAYQMGVSGLLKFKGMIGALKEQNYEQASAEMIDSVWYKQTPNRAKKLADRMKEIK